MSGSDLSKQFRASGVTTTAASGVGLWPILVLVLSLTALAAVALHQTGRLSLPGILVAPPADPRGQALLTLTHGLDLKSLPPLSLATYRMTPEKFRMAPAEIRDELTKSLKLHQRKAPQWAVLALISTLNTREPNTALMRGLALSTSGGSWGIDLIRSAAEMGLAPAQALYGIALLGNPSLQPKEQEGGQSWLRKAMASGDTDATYALAYALLTDRSATARGDGIELLRLAARNGSLSAMRLMAGLLARGQIVEKDLQAAEHYALRAAESGDPHSQGLFGAYLVAISGAGQPDRLLEAVRHLTRASQGNSIDDMVRAMHLLGMIHVDYAKEPPFRNAATGVGWFQRCAAWAHRDCYYSLGRAYETGSGIEASAVQAAAHFKAAHELGERRGQTSFDRVAVSLDAADRATALAAAKALLGRAGAVADCKDFDRAAKDCFFLPDGRVPTFSETMRAKGIR